jgi:hypothetical protein
MRSPQFIIKATLVVALVMSWLARIWLCSLVPWFARGWPEYLSYLIVAIPVLILATWLGRRYPPSA